MGALLDGLNVSFIQDRTDLDGVSISERKSPCYKPASVLSFLKPSGVDTG